MDGIGQAFNRRRIGAFASGSRRLQRTVAPLNISQVTHRSEDGSEHIKHCRSKLDSHADTCGVNIVAKALEYYGAVAEVSGFVNSMDAITDAPIVKAAVAYEDLNTGETFVLDIDQALYFGDQLTHILLNPNQMKIHGIIVDEVPTSLYPSLTHSITSKEEDFKILLSLRGIISYFPVHTPTEYEIENSQHIALTSGEEWNPNSSLLESFEQPYPDLVINISAFTLNACKEYDLLIHKLNRHHLSIASTTTSNKRLFVKESELATRWAIGIKDAQDTIKVTTQKFIRNALHPIERHFRTKNVMLHYNQMVCQFSSDTFFSNAKLILQNTCAQLFITDFGYGKFSPMKLKSEAGYALKGLIQDVGIPRIIHMDDVRELETGEFART